MTNSRDKGSLACPLMHAPPRAAKPQARSDLIAENRRCCTLLGAPLFSVGKKGSALPFCSKSREVPPPMGKQYAILRVQKCKGAEIGAMQYHNDREPGKAHEPGHRPIEPG